MSKTMGTPLTALALAAAALGAVAPAPAALAQQGRDGYPRVLAQGENFQVDYGPGPPNNVVGGGRVAVAGGGEDVRITHLDPLPPPSHGLIPVVVAQGENFAVVWVPAAGPSPAMLAAGAGTRPGEAARR
jgi:hypothetical protein